MIITTRGKNALKIMVYLAMNQGESYVRLKDIATREGLSEKYLESIVASLRRNNKVISARGAEGGYRLARTANGYTVGEIIKCLEGDLRTTDCVSQNTELCERKCECICLPLWEKMNDALNEVLENTTLQDLIDRKVG